MDCQGGFSEDASKGQGVHALTEIPLKTSNVHLRKTPGMKEELVELEWAGIIWPPEFAPEMPTTPPLSS